MSDDGFDNLLELLTDAILTEQDYDLIIESSDMPFAQINSFVEIINKLHTTLVPQQPDEQFTKSLKSELMGQNQGVLTRMPALPSRVRFAAGVAAALAAGVMLIARYRPNNGKQTEHTEVPVLQ